MMYFKLLWPCLIFALFSLFFSCQKEDTTDLSSTPQPQNFINFQKASKIGFEIIPNLFVGSSKGIGNSENTKISQVVPINDKRNVAAFYVINYQGGGFLLLAADNRVNPILAYSENDFFEVNLDNKPQV